VEQNLRIEGKCLLEMMEEFFTFVVGSVKDIFKWVKILES
jgi:hypothetical protein